MGCIIKGLHCNLIAVFLLQVAKESAMQFNPDANITAYHDSVMRYS